MIKDLWCADAGTALLAEAKNKAEEFAEKYPGSRYIAFHTDLFSAGREASLMKEFRPTLLEMRIFTEEAEYHLFRTSTGSPFQYRVADDGILRKNLETEAPSDPFLRDPEHHRLVTRQLLDINTAHPAFRRQERDQNGCRLLTTTGGGHYALPLEEGDRAAVVVQYVRYDPGSGVGRVVDERIAGFEPLQGGERE